MHKTVKAIALAAAMSFAVVAAPDLAAAQHHHGGHGHGGWGYGAAAGVIGGLAAGAIISSMAANQGYYYGSGYYVGPGYVYGPGYYAGPGYAYRQGYYYGQDAYAYEAPVYVRPAPRYYRGGTGVQNGCWVATDTTRGFGYYGPCY